MDGLKANFVDAFSRDAFFFFTSIYERKNHNKYSSTPFVFQVPFMSLQVGMTSRNAAAKMVNEIIRDDDHDGMLSSVAMTLHIIAPSFF